MDYILRQYNQKTELLGPASNSYMTLYRPGSSGSDGGTAKRKTVTYDSSSTVIGGLAYPFEDECVTVSNLSEKNTYYLHGKIKRRSDSNQNFSIFLCNYEDENNANQQYLKNITVSQGQDDKWLDFEIIFTPKNSSFDCILFELKRLPQDYGENVRYPVIVYEELSIINNIINSKLSSEVQNNGKLIKIGVQSHPDLIMCINKEEIHIGRSGMYEIKNGIITVDFFSTVKAAVENPSATNGLKWINKDGSVSKVGSLNEYLNKMIKENFLMNKTYSRCLFKYDKLRTIDGFSLDYMAKINED